MSNVATAEIMMKRFIDVAALLAVGAAVYLVRRRHADNTSRDTRLAAQELATHARHVRSRAFQA